MLTIAVPGKDALHLKHLLLAFNGSSARDGVLLVGVADRLGRLAKKLQNHMITGDTLGHGALALAGLPCWLVILESADQAEAWTTCSGHSAETGERTEMRWCWSVTVHDPSVGWNRIHSCILRRAERCRAERPGFPQGTQR